MDAFGHLLGPRFRLGKLGLSPRKGNSTGFPAWMSSCALGEDPEALLSALLCCGHLEIAPRGKSDDRSVRSGGKNTCLRHKTIFKRGRPMVTAPRFFFGPPGKAVRVCHTSLPPWQTRSSDLTTSGKTP